MNICHYIPTKYLDDKGYNARLRYLFKQVCYLQATGTGTVSSVGLSMPSAFTVTNSPITSSGTLAVTGAGTTSQYIRGDGSLATYGTATAVPISGLTAATGVNNINNSTYSQTWQWGNVASDALALVASTTAASGNNQVLFRSILLGANSNINQLTRAAEFSNTHTGTGSTNIAASFTATGGTNNYAIKLVDGSQGLSKVLTSDANGNASWATPSAPSLTATQIAFGDGSNLMTSSSDFIYNPTQRFNVKFSGNIGLSADPDNQEWIFGDYAGAFGHGNTFYLNNNASQAFYDNTAHTGFFGINTSSPSVALDVVGDFTAKNNNIGISYTGGSRVVSIGDYEEAVNATYLNIDDANTLFHFFNAPIQIDNLAGTGTRAVLADSSGALSAPVSDISVKENIEPLNYGLKTLKSLNPVSFYFKDGYKNYGERRQIGFIAQEVEEVLPDSVFESNNGLKGYNITDMIPILVNCIKELTTRIEQLEQQ